MTRSTKAAGAVLGGSVIALAFALIYLVYRAVTGAGPLFSITPTPAVQRQPAEVGPAGWYSLYFTDPSGPNADTLRGGPDAALAQAIEAARLSVDVAIYDLDLWSIRDALLEAHRRGVTVRVVAESDNLDEREMQQLIDAGIQVLGDRREGLMHNKFVVIDRLEVWTGSMNFTVNGAYRNDNNLIRLRSSRLAENFLSEFEEMYLEDRFGPGSPANTPHRNLTVQGVPLEVYFSPDDRTASRLLEVIAGAQESVHFMAFSFTSDEIAQALIDRARAGVAVAGVFEDRQIESNQGTEYGRLRSAGLQVYRDGSGGNMHHKVIVVDRRIVITGSYNFSASAERRNDENTLIIHSPEIAALYMAEFDRIFGLAQ